MLGKLPRPTHMAEAVAVWYAAVHLYYGGGMAAPAQIDDGWSQLFEWGVGVPLEETWGLGSTPGGMAAIEAMLSEG